MQLSIPETEMKEQHLLRAWTVEMGHATTGEKDPAMSVV